MNSAAIRARRDAPRSPRDTSDHRASLRNSPQNSSTAKGLSTPASRNSVKSARARAAGVPDVFRCTGDHSAGTPEISVARTSMITHRTPCGPIVSPCISPPFRKETSKFRYSKSSPATCSLISPLSTSVSVGNRWAWSPIRVFGAWNASVSRKSSAAPCERTLPTVGLSNVIDRGSGGIGVLIPVVGCGESRRLLEALKYCKVNGHVRADRGRAKIRP